MKFITDKEIEEFSHRLSERAEQTKSFSFSLTTIDKNREDWIYSIAAGYSNELVKAFVICAQKQENFKGIILSTAISLAASDTMLGIDLLKQINDVMNEGGQDYPTAKA